MPNLILFRLSPKEFRGGVNKVRRWLKRDIPRRGGWILFRKDTPKKLTTGSKMIFSIENRIVGEAIAKSEVESYRDKSEPQYEARVFFEVPSIIPYRRVVSFSEVDLRHYGRVFTYLSQAQYKEIVKAARTTPPLQSTQTRRRLKRQGRHYRRGEESTRHKRLKAFLRQHPDKLESEMTFREEEYLFPTNDSIDLVFSDCNDRYVVVEVEVEVVKGGIEGLLQAIKYKHMLAVEKGLDFRDVRSMLVAVEIHPSVMAMCKKYGVETKVLFDAGVSQHSSGKWSCASHHKDLDIPFVTAGLRARLYPMHTMG